LSQFTSFSTHQQLMT